MNLLDWKLLCFDSNLTGVFSVFCNWREVRFGSDYYAELNRRWRLYIWPRVTYLDDGGYISARLLHIWTMEVIYLHECYISGRWRLYVRTIVTYLDDGGYISARLLHIWTMEVIYLHDCYISGRWRLHSWPTATHLDHEGYIAGLPLHIWAVTYLHATRHILYLVLLHDINGALCTITRNNRTRKNVASLAKHCFSFIGK